MNGRRSFAAATLLGLACAALVLAPAGGQAAKKKGKKPQKKPNVVFVMTDDQAAEQMRFMPKTNALLGQGGVTFRNSFSSYPLCCPSRATWLTGQYAHNHDVRTNQPPSGGYGKIAPTLSNSLPAWLQKAGYRTAHVGKFLNGYGRTSLRHRGPSRLDRVVRVARRSRRLRRRHLLDVRVHAERERLGRPLRHDPRGRGS